jgi:hypothetical protein
MQGYNGLNISRAMYIAQSNLYSIADEAVEQMKIVEGDTKLADLQGFIAGTNDAKNILIEAGFDLVPADKREFLNLDSLDYIELAELEAQAQEKDERWHEYEAMRETLEKEKKEFLYSDDCTKGRDLAYIHAWKRAVNFIERFFNKIVLVANKEKERGPAFEF